MFQTNKLYKHENAKDTAILPIVIEAMPDKDWYKMVVEWYNVTSGKARSIGVLDNIQISFEDTFKWKEWHE